MVFSSVLFLFYFLPIVLGIYYCIPKGWKNGFLFFSSLVFYAWGEPIYVLLMLFSTLVDFKLGLFIEKSLQQSNKPKAKKGMIISIVINLSLLFFFKYSHFFLQSIGFVLSKDTPLFNLALPLGISFYTFQTMSYSIDIYRKKSSAQHKFLDFGAYVALFPQLVAGPIVSYHTIAEQLKHRSLSFFHLHEGVKLFLIGLGKKVLLANSFGAIYQDLSNLHVNEQSVALLWLSILCYALQIYFDFSGYSEMAIGLGRLLGFEFLKNFNYPYVAKSISEFWRRWHISLTQWFFQYLYLPLGGNRVSKMMQIRNLALVWLLSGLWHGANWNFILWGGYFAFWLILEKFYLKDTLCKLPSLLQHVYTLFILLVGWAIFVTEDIGKLSALLKQMFFLTPIPILHKDTLYYLFSSLPLLVLGIFCCTPLFSNYTKHLKKLTVYPLLELLGFALLGYLSLSYLVSTSYNPFLYFRF